MTHAEFANKVMAEWNITPEQIYQSCYCQWYHYITKVDGKDTIIGDYTLRNGKDVFVIYLRDGGEVICE